MANVLEITIQAIDNASAAMKAMSGKVEKSLKGMQTQLRVAGAAFTAVGIAGLKMVSDARAINAQLGQTAITIGATSKELRNMVLATTNVTFGVKSVTATFDLLARAGVRNKEEMKAAANAFDALADATGSSAEVIADLLLPAFKLFGEEIPQTSAELDKFTWLTKNTLVDLSDFGTLLTRMAPYMDTLNMSMDDAIATLAALSEQGIVGTAATLKLRTAITQAAESGEDLNTILGISQEEIDGFKIQMSDATGITDKYAKVANDQFGIMDKLKQKWDELTLAAGSFLTPLEPILALMTALGPVMLFFSTSMGIAAVKTGLLTTALVAQKIALVGQKIALGAATAATWLFNAALAANPIVLIIAGIVALIAAGIAIWANWSKIVAWFKGEAKDVTKVTAEEIQKQLAANLKAINAKKTAARDEYSAAVENIRKVYGIEQTTSLNKIELARKESEETRKLLNRDLDAARKASSDRISLYNKEYDAKFRVLNIETEAILGDYQTRLDNLDELTEAEDKIIRESERQKREEELRTEVAQATTASERLDAEKRLADYLTQMGRERSREQINEQKATIRAEMEEVRKNATKKRETLQTELNDKITHEKNLLAETEKGIEKQLAGLEDALIEKKRILKEELKEHEKNEGLKLQATLNRLDQERIAAYRNIPGGLGTTMPAPTPIPYIPGVSPVSPYPRGSPYNPIPGGPGYIPLLSLQFGGVVPGKVGQPVPILAHAGETFLGVGQRTLPELSGGSSSFLSEERNTIVNINIEGSVTTEHELADTIRRVFYDIRRHNFTLEMT